MIAEYMGADHQRCDRIFAEAEQTIAEGDWVSGAAGFEQMRQAIESHFLAEEELLFPRFEAETGMTMGPTAMMRHEHQQMRQLFTSMARAVAERDGDGYLGSAETLLILMQQHNAKEEQILYPMIDSHLSTEAAGLVEQVKGFV